MTSAEAVNRLKSDIYKYADFQDNPNEDEFWEAFDMAIKALEQESVLDKIRAEIEEIHLIGYATIDGKREIASRAVMQIIDKYKAESEEE